MKLSLSSIKDNLNCLNEVLEIFGEEVLTIDDIITTHVLSVSDMDLSEVEHITPVEKLTVSEIFTPVSEMKINEVLTQLGVEMTTTGLILKYPQSKDKIYEQSVWYKFFNSKIIIPKEFITTHRYFDFLPNSDKVVVRIDVSKVIEYNDAYRKYMFHSMTEEELQHQRIMEKKKAIEHIK